MFQGWAIVLLAIGYVGALFAVAWFGDRMPSRTGTAAVDRGHPFLYALSLGVFCTSWTFFGSVGLAATTGFDFIPVYIGAILMFALGWQHALSRWPTIQRWLWLPFALVFASFDAYLLLRVILRAMQA